MSNRRTILGSFGGGLAAAVLPRAAVAQSAPPPKIRIGITAADSFAEGYYGRDEGYFERAGLDVEITHMSTGGQISVAVAGNAVDLGMTNMGQLSNAISHGAPFVVVAGGGLYSNSAPSSALVVAKSSPIRTARDLEGKTCSCTALKDLTQVVPSLWMQRNGGDPSKTKFVEIPFSEIAAALDRGTIDAGVLTEPWLTSSNGTTVRVLAYPYGLVAPQFLLSPWFTTRDYQQRNGPLIRRFAAAIYETARWTNTHRDESGELLAKYSGIQLATIQHMARTIWATSLDAAQIRPVLDLMYQFGAIDKPLSAEAIIAA